MWFKYFEFILHNDGEIEGDINHQIQVGQMKWRMISGILCDTNLRFKLNESYYQTVVNKSFLLLLIVIYTRSFSLLVRPIRLE